MVMVDKNSLALISVNDPELMVSKPAALTAATGMDALTHAVEALVTPGAYGVTKKLSIGAIELIKEYLPRAVKDGHDIEAREGMVNAIFFRRYVIQQRWTRICSLNGSPIRCCLQTSTRCMLCYVITSNRTRKCKTCSSCIP